MSPRSGLKLNFLDYELRRTGVGAGFTHELVTLIKTAMDGGRDRSSREPFWEDATAQLLTNAIDLATIATGSVSLEQIAEIIRSAPSTEDQVSEICFSRFLESRRASGEPVWADRSLAARLLIAGDAAVKSHPRGLDFQETFRFWTSEFATLDSRTRSNIVCVLMTRLSGLLRSPYRELFSTETSITPEQSFAGRIIVMDLPVKEYGEVGRFAQVLFKTVWQRAAERRGSLGGPIFLWADEAQYFASRYDALFQQTARSSRVATVYLTQSIANFREAFGDSSEVSAVDSLVGTLQTKIFHANGCPVTNRFAQDTFGEELQWLTSISVDGGEVSHSAQRALAPILPGSTFTTLRKGGPQNNGEVEAYLFQAGRKWNSNDGKNHLLVRFKQDAAF